MTVNDLAQKLLPLVRDVLVSRKDEFISAVIKWVRTKKLLGFAAPLIAEIVWKFTSNAALPVLLRVFLMLVLGGISPYILPFEPLIEWLLNAVDPSVVDVKTKADIRELLALCAACRGNVTQLSPGRQVELMSDQDDLAAYADNQMEFFANV